MAYDNATTSTSTTFSHTVSGSHTILTVGIYLRGTNPTITGVTYNGVAMSFANGFNGSANTCQIYELVNPASGANNVVYTTGGTVVFNNAVALSLNGMNQIVANCSNASSQASVTTISDTLTPVSSPISLEVVNVISALGVVASISAQNSATIKASVFSGNAPIGVSYKVESSPTTISTGWDRNDVNNNYMGEVAVAYIPLSLKITQGSYTLTREPLTALTVSRLLTAAQASYTFNFASNILFKIHHFIQNALSTATPSNQASHTATMTNQSGHTATVTDQTQH